MVFVYFPIPTKSMQSSKFDEMLRVLNKHPETVDYVSQFRVNSTSIAKFSENAQSTWMITPPTIGQLILDLKKSNYKTYVPDWNVNNSRAFPYHKPQIPPSLWSSKSP